MDIVSGHQYLHSGFIAMSHPSIVLKEICKRQQFRRGSHNYFVSSVLLFHQISTEFFFLSIILSMQNVKLIFGKMSKINQLLPLVPKF